MKRLSLFCAALCFATPVLAQTNDRVLDSMIKDWAEYDYACRGTNPSDGSEGFCGARQYIGSVLTRNGFCLNENMTPDAIVIACDKPGAYPIEDPISDELRSMF